MSVESTRPRRWLLLAAVCGPIALVSFDSTAMPLAIPSMVEGLGVSLSIIAWVYVGYATVAASMPLLGGWFIGAFSAKRVLIASMALGCAASIGAAFAPDFLMLEVCRILQACGFAAGLPAALAIIAAEFPTNRSRVVGIWGMAGGLAAVVGQLIAGLLIASTSWRAVPLIEALIAGATSLLALKMPVSSSRVESVRVPLGPLALGSATALALSATILTATRGTVGTAWIVGSVVLTGALALLTSLSLRRHRSGMISPFVAWRIRLNLVGVFLFAMSYVGMLVALPLALIGQLPLDTGGVAIALTPAVLVSALLQPVGGTLAKRFGHVRSALLGFAVMVGGLFLLAVADSQVWVLLVGVTVASVGVGLVNPVLIDAAIAFAPKPLSTISGAIVLTVRQLGLATGAAVVFATTTSSGSVNDVSASLRFSLLFALVGFCCYVLLSWVSQRLAKQ